MDALRAEFQAQVEMYLKSIQSRVEALFKQGIDEAIYQYYSPVEYRRTYMFLNSVKAHIDLATGKMYVYSDINTGYHSVVSGDDVTNSISNWLESGHYDGRGSGEYHSYEKRDYLERCYELIHNEFPELTLEIIKE